MVIVRRKSIHYCYKFVLANRFACGIMEGMEHKARPIENWTIAFVNKCLANGEKIPYTTLMRWCETWNLHHSGARECVRYNKDANMVIVYET